MFSISTNADHRDNPDFNDTPLFDTVTTDH